MRPEEYRSLIKRLETHYQEFLLTSKGSEMFGEDDKQIIQGHFEKAQDHYETLVIQLPSYSEFRKTSLQPVLQLSHEQWLLHQCSVFLLNFSCSLNLNLNLNLAPADEGEDGEKVIKEEVMKPSKAASHTSTLSITLLTSLQELHRRLELAESGLTSHLHVPLGDNKLHECTVHIQELQVLISPEHVPENTHTSCIIVVICCYHRVPHHQLKTLQSCKTSLQCSIGASFEDLFSFWNKTFFFVAFKNGTLESRFFCQIVSVLFLLTVSLWLNVATNSLLSNILYILHFKHLHFHLHRRQFGSWLLPWKDELFNAF